MKTFGSDPEFMLFLNNKPVSAIDVIKASSFNRIKFKNHEFYYDNVLAECAIKPAKTKEDVVKNFKECIKKYRLLAAPCTLELKASANFDDTELLHEDARKVGCAKDCCAYEMQIKDGPIEEITHGNLRSCGGHIHIGADILTSDGPEPILMVYLMDLFLGVPSLWLDRDSSSPQRRKLYGHAGRYRIKPYGIEYRSLGNFWLESPEMVGLIYDLTMFCLNLVETESAWKFWSFDLDSYLETGEASKAWKCLLYSPEALRTGINQTNKELVKEHFDLVKKTLPVKLKNKLLEQIDRRESNFHTNW